MIYKTPNFVFLVQGNHWSKLIICDPLDADKENIRMKLLEWVRSATQIKIAKYTVIVAVFWIITAIAMIYI